MKPVERTVLMVPMKMYVDNAYSRDTACELKAVDRERFAAYPAYVELARQTAAGADDMLSPKRVRLECLEELKRLMDKLCGTTWRAGEIVDERTEMQFWLDVWLSMQSYAPEAAVFQKYSREDLINEVLDDTSEYDTIERGYN